MTMHKVQSEQLRPAVGIAVMDEDADKLLVRTMREALVEFAGEPPSRIADWIAGVADPARPTVSHLISDPEVSLEALARAKDLYKLLRVLGTETDLRRMGRRMYAATIAAAMVHHQSRISDQSPMALGRAFHFLLMADTEVPKPVREIVQQAAAMLPQMAKAAQPAVNVDGRVSFDEAVKVARQREDAKQAAPPPESAGSRRRETYTQRKRTRREAARRAGTYDPTLGAYFQKRRAYCSACRDVVEIRRRVTNQSLHLWLSAMTLGLWLPVWGVLELTTRLRVWNCVNCRRRIYQAMIS